MDLKSKTMAWVGNIYQKFEAIGQDMDDIMNQSQDRVKYVENQVQNIGVSVKKFYSDVAHDLLPPLVGPVKRESQVLAWKKNAMLGTYIKSIMGIENDPTDAVNKQLCSKTDKVGSVENQPDHVVSGLPNLSQLVTPTFVNPPNGQDFDHVSRQMKDVLKVEKLAEQAEDNVMMEMPSASGVLGLLKSVEDGFSRGPLLNELVDRNHREACGSVTNVSPTTSVHGTLVESSENMEKHCDHDCFSGVSSATTPEINFSVVFHVENMECFLLNCHHKDACGSGTNVSRATSLYGTQVESSKNVERHRDNDCLYDVSSTVAPPEMNFSVVSNEEKVAETEVDSSRNALLNCHHHKDACGSGTNFSPATSVYGTQVESSQNVEKLCDNYCVSVVSNTVPSPETNISFVSDDENIAETEVESCRSSLLDSNCKDACESRANVSPVTSVHGTQVEASQNVDRHYDTDLFSGVSSTTLSPETNISVVSSDEKMAETEVDSSRSSLLDCNQKYACEHGTNVSPVISVHGMHVESSQSVDRYCDNDFFSDVSSTIASPEMNISVFSIDAKMAETEVDSSRSSLLDCNQKDASESGTNVSPITSVHSTQGESSQNVDRHFDNDCFSDVSCTIASPATNFAVDSSDEKLAQTDVDSFRSSLLTEPYYVFTNSPESFCENAECYRNSVCMSRAIHDGPGAFTSFTLIPSHEIKVVEMVPSRCVLRSISVGNSSVGFSQAPVRSPTSCIGAPSYSRNGDVDYSKLETIELSDKVKLENGCDTVDDSFLYVVSRRSQKLRSFKKKIQDAFASRKRLEKEYEQLAIWFGDVDMGPGQDDLQNRLQSTATTILETGSYAHLCDSETEWELL